MARRIVQRRKKFKLALSFMINIFNIMCMMYLALERHYRKYLLKNEPEANRDVIRHVILRRLIYSNDLTCFENLRMDRYSFNKLCLMLHTTGKLKDSKNMRVDEMVAMFLFILGHHKKNSDKV